MAATEVSQAAGMKLTESGNVSDYRTEYGCEGECKSDQRLEGNQAEALFERHGYASSTCVEE